MEDEIELVKIKFSNAVKIWRPDLREPRPHPPPYIDHIIGKIIPYTLHHVDDSETRNVFIFLYANVRLFSILNNAIINNCELFSSRHHLIFNDVALHIIERMIPKLKHLSDEAVDHLKERFYRYHRPGLNELARHFPEKFFRQPFTHEILYYMDIGTDILEIMKSQNVPQYIIEKFERKIIIDVD